MHEHFSEAQGPASQYQHSAIKTVVEKIKHEHHT